MSVGVEECFLDCVARSLELETSESCPPEINDVCRSLFSKGSEVELELSALWEGGSGLKSKVVE
jgi:hypothetical protein